MVGVSFYIYQMARASLELSNASVYALELATYQPRSTFSNWLIFQFQFVNLRWVLPPANRGTVKIWLFWSLPNFNRCRFGFCTHRQTLRNLEMFLIKQNWVPELKTMVWYMLQVQFQHTLSQKRKVGALLDILINWAVTGVHVEEEGLYSQEYLSYLAVFQPLTRNCIKAAVKLVNSLFNFWLVGITYCSFVNHDYAWVLLKLRRC